MIRVLAFLAGDRRGGSAAEFALVLPLLIILLFGILDAGRWMWESNQQEKATQAAARWAVVTDPVFSGLESFSFATDYSSPITGGDIVPAADFGGAVCTNTSCNCTGSACGEINYSHDAAAFDAIRQMIAYHYRPVPPENLTIRYDNVGLGFSGDPNGPDVAPLVTVELTGLSFTPLFFQILGINAIPMPDIATALTAEDMTGDYSN
ncbi:TadE/TadG family type IV pilus assembly protein [Sphingomicrobium astaxanthinifaciens]|uniref:TadE/TadG family type IV pilus assembly protein n=1 Tax=Sphingomicrobium astaxanthinifaciens TaxID=1227949 RepID=UPI001FCA4F1F|nr:TadE/TadG family type IV pilus assembly protein [Sphingomicrobium astaxanthinifaciens]MCJ7421285.1 pilus assembly protein [Sphingomicrobium astaxanthinifaciens]